MMVRLPLVVSSNAAAQAESVFSGRTRWGMPPPHPAVLKKDGTDERLRRRSPELRASFWDLDGRLRGLEDVTAIYFKNVARYRVSRGQFAEAKIDPLVIRWRFAQPGSWRDSTKLTASKCLGCPMQKRSFGNYDERIEMQANTYEAPGCQEHRPPLTKRRSP